MYIVKKHHLGSVWVQSSIRTTIFLLQKQLHSHQTVETGRGSWDHPSAAQKVDRRCHHFVMRPKGQLLHEHKAYALLLSIKTRWSKLQMTGQSRKWQQVTKGSLFWLKTKIIHVKSSNEWVKEKATALLSRIKIFLLLKRVEVNSQVHLCKHSCFCYCMRFSWSSDGKFS